MEVMLVMTFRQIETSREVRLWLTQIIIPAGVIATVVMTNPELKEAVTTKYNEVKSKIKNKLHK
jgi:hypothetical protein